MSSNIFILDGGFGAVVICHPRGKCLVGGGIFNGVVVGVVEGGDETIGGGTCGCSRQLT